MLRSSYSCTPKVVSWLEKQAPSKNNAQHHAQGPQKLFYTRRSIIFPVHNILCIARLSDRLVVVKVSYHRSVNLMLA